MGRLEIILALIVMSVFGGSYFCIHQSFSKNVGIATLFIGILSILSSKVSVQELKEFSTY